MASSDSTVRREAGEGRQDGFDTPVPEHAADEGLRDVSDAPVPELSAGEGLRDASDTPVPELSADEGLPDGSDTPVPELSADEGLRDVSDTPVPDLPADEGLRDASDTPVPEHSADEGLRDVSDTPVPELSAGEGLRDASDRLMPEHYQSLLTTQATIDSHIVRRLVKVHPGVPVLDWIAAQMVTINVELNHLIGLLLKTCCFDETCPRMSAGAYTVYNWADEEHPTPRPVSAPVYMRCTAKLVATKLSDRRLMPLTGSVPQEFDAAVRMMCKRIFRVYAHAYLSHFETFRENCVDAHLNCLYKHFLFLVKEFDLVSDNDLLPLSELSERFLAQGESVSDEIQEASEREREAVMRNRFLHSGIVGTGPSAPA